jgi:F0F1-type ATP synthase assembly protein I
MFRRLIALLLLVCMSANASRAFAAEAPRGPAAPEVLASGNVEISRNGAENPMVEIARSVMWGAVAGFVVGGAIALAAKDDSGESIRWGIVAGTVAGLGAGVYFVSHRPQPTAMLDLHDGKLSPNPAALGAIEPVQGGARARLVGVRF